MATKPTKNQTFEHAYIVGPLAVDIPEACKLTSLSRSRLYGEIREGRLKVRKAGRRTVIAMTDLESWLASLPAA